MAIWLRSVASTILAGVRPRFVAMTVKLFSLIREGSTVISIQDLSEWMMA